MLLYGTVRENVQWGKENATDEEILVALDVSQSREFVDGLEGGLDFKIAQGGKNLSRGSVKIKPSVVAHTVF